MVFALPIPGMTGASQAPAARNGERLSALLIRRSKSLAGLECPSKGTSPCGLEGQTSGGAACGLERQTSAGASPVEMVQGVARMAGKALQFLSDRSPMAGAPAKALLKKISSKRRSTTSALPSSLPAPEDVPSREVDPAVAEVGFVRLVYKKARSLHVESGSRYKSLKEVALDIMHSVRVCMQVRRFIELAKLASNGRALLDQEVQPRALHRVFGAAKAEVPPSPQVTEAANCKWQSLLDDLSPMTPQVCSLAQIPSPVRAKANDPACSPVKENE